MLFVAIFLLQMCLGFYSLAIEAQEKQDENVRRAQLNPGSFLYVRPKFKFAEQETALAGVSIDIEDQVSSSMKEDKSNLFSKQKSYGTKIIINKPKHINSFGRKFCQLGKRSRQLARSRIGPLKSYPISSRAVHPSSQKLFELIKRQSRIEKIKKEIEAGADINGEYAYATPLNTAVRYGTEEVVKYLVARGAQVNKGVGADNLTPIRTAIREINYSMVSLLIDLGAEVNYAARYNETPLYDAISRFAIWPKGKSAQQAFNIIELLLKNGAEIIWPASLNSYQKSKKEKFIGIIKKAQSALYSTNKQIIVYKSPESILFELHNN